MALTIANMKKTKHTLSRNQIIPGTQFKGGMSRGGSQPPRNRMVVSAHITVIDTYSPSMNSRYGVEEYSTMKPPIGQYSASGKSKGAVLVSTNADTKKMMNFGNRGSQYQLKRP